MLYLLESNGYYKIGHTSDLSRRLKIYDTCNPNYTVLYTKDGDTIDEVLLHKLCKQYLFKNEGFYKNEEIIDIFNNADLTVEREQLNLDRILQKRENAKRYRKKQNQVSNKKKLFQYDMDGNFIATGNSQSEAEKALGLYQSAISKCIRGLQTHAGGYKWSYEK